MYELGAFTFFYVFFLSVSKFASKLPHVLSAKSKQWGICKLLALSIYILFTVECGYYLLS